MRRLKIAVYTMAKNEAQHVEQYCDTVAGADIVVVTDTGSTDGTPELLRKHGVVVREAAIMPWRFDTATNVALANVPADIDVCVKLDLDERLVPPVGGSWRDAIEAAWKDKTTQLHYTYVWSWAPGQVGKVPGVQFTACHIHARAGFIWRHPGHAALTCIGTDNVVAQSCGLQIHHYPTSKSRPDYLPLLQLAVRENECPRTLFYLGREYAAKKMHDQAIATLVQYLEHKQAYWHAERAEAMRLIGTCFASQQQHPQAVRWLIQATTEYKTAREPWYALLDYMLSIKDWDGAVWVGTKCLGITKRDLGYVTQSADAWSSSVYIKLAMAYAQAGHKDKQIKTLETGLSAFPHCDILLRYALSTQLFEKA
jgi:tetratricopeptide (TPR) repeat protein